MTPLSVGAQNKAETRAAKVVAPTKRSSDAPVVPGVVVVVVPVEVLVPAFEHETPDLAVNFASAKFAV